jgi:hypothetical protein
VAWIDLTQDRNRLRAFVRAVMNLPCSIKLREFLDLLRNCWLFRRTVFYGDSMQLLSLEHVMEFRRFGK